MFLNKMICRISIYGLLLALSLRAHDKFCIYQFLLPGDLVFDVGAHVGNKTEIYRSYGARVVCVEPQPGCVSLLEKKFNNDSRVSIVAKGLSSKSGKMKLHICSKADTLSTFSTSWMIKGRFFEQGYTWDKTIEVAVITLDDLIRLYGCPRYCKIDVENFEYEVLCGLSRAVPYISIEFAKEFLESTLRCLDRLTLLGYDLFNIAEGETDHFTFNSWVSRDEIVSFIISNKNEDLWGDVYAHKSDNV